MKDVCEVFNEIELLILEETCAWQCDVDEHDDDDDDAN